MRIQRVELLVQPVLGGDPGIDRAADRFDGGSLHGRASIARPVSFVPEAKEARAVPFGAGDGEGDLGEAVIGLAVPGKAVGHHHHPLRLPIPLPDQHRTGRKFVRFWSKLARRADIAGPASFATVRSKHLLGCVVEIAEAISLKAIGDDRKQQMPRQMGGG